MLCLSSAVREDGITFFNDAAAAADSSAWFFFFQAEDGIRDLIVTGVQTCALPISRYFRCPDCADGGGGAALARADPTARRSGGGVVRARGHHRRGPGVPRLGEFRDRKSVV